LRASIATARTQHTGRAGPTTATLASGRARRRFIGTAGREYENESYDVAETIPAAREARCVVNNIFRFTKSHFHPSFRSKRPLS
jgi:hypothetical protein